MSLSFVSTFCYAQTWSWFAHVRLSWTHQLLEVLAPSGNSYLCISSFALAIVILKVKLLYEMLKCKTFFVKNFRASFNCTFFSVSASVGTLCCNTQD